MEQIQSHESTSINKVRFLLPSLLGALIFLTPVPWDGRITIGIGVITNAILNLMGNYGLHLLIVVMVLTSVLTLLGTVFRVSWILRRVMPRELFAVPPVWLILRLIGTAFGLVYFLQLGPELLKSETIGGAVYVGIGINVIAVYTSACLLLPLLTDFGLMEFIGTLARPFFRRVFQLPGRAAIDAVTSLVGASSIGLLVSIGQYDRGHYTSREASVIATNFSIVSLPFSLVVATVSGIEHLFIPWYGIVILACLTAALITPRLPPLSRKEEAYIAIAPVAEPGPEIDTHTLLTEAWRKALRRADQAPDLRSFFAVGLKNLMFFLFSVVTATMALATIAALLVFETPLFSWLGTPFIPLLEIMQLPEAAAASPALFSGFLDQYMPAVAATSIDSNVTSFVLAGLSVCQLVFMSEVGVIILRSSLPISLMELLVIFLLRTVIVLPVLIFGAHVIAV